MLKLLFGLVGALMVMAFLASFVWKVQEPAMVAVTLAGVAMMLVDVWQARNEPDN